MENKKDVIKKYESCLCEFDKVFKQNVHDNSTVLEKKIFGDALKDYIDNINNILLVLKMNNKIEEYNSLKKHISSDFSSRGLSKLEVLIDVDR